MTEPGWVGRSLSRREDERLLTGTGSFVDDLAPEGTAHLALVRSPFAHARLGAIEMSAARDLPGVIAALTAADVGEAVRPLPTAAIPLPEALWVAPGVANPILAADVARFVGEPVAAVLAGTRATAEDAAELVQVDYEPLPPVGEVRAAIQGGDRVHGHLADNVLLRWRLGRGDVEGAFRSAAHVVAARLRLPRLVAAPIEPRGCLASYDARADLLTLRCSSQDPHRPLRQLCHVLDRPVERTRVVVPDVGGAFGSKGGLAPEHVLACLLAMRTGRPVKWIETRSENFVAAYQGRGVEVDAELAVDADGRFLAVRVRLMTDAGAYVLGHTAAPPVNAALLLTGAYDIPAADVEVLGVATNRVPTGPYRGAGRPEATYVIERLVDLAARALGVDPIELRHRNLVQPAGFPHATPLGSTYDSGDYPRALRRACALLDYGAWRERQRLAREARGERPLIGIGGAVFVESSGNGGWEAAAASVWPDGSVTLRTGSTATGQGHRTAFAQIAADALGLDPAEVEVRQGDSAEVPLGVGTFASRSVTVGGSAVLRAAEELRAQLGRVAAHVLEVGEEDLRWDGSRFQVAGSPDRSMDVREVAGAAASMAGAPAGQPVFQAEARFDLPDLVYGSGAYLAVVEVDAETGNAVVLRLVGVDDAGILVNPTLAEGQVTGSVVQGLAASLFEEVVHDDTGQPLTASFLGYATPSAADVPGAIETEFQQTPSPRSPLGTKGVAESGTIGVPAAVAAAIADALSPFGVRHVDPPFAPEKLWRLIHAARGGASRGAKRANDP